MTDKPHAPNTHTRLARLASTGSFLSAGLAAWLYIKPRTRGLASNMVGYGLKILAAAFSPLISLMGLLGAMGARRTQQRFAALAGGVGALLAAHYVKRVTEPHDGFERAYGSGKGTANPITAAPNDASSPAERQSTVGAASETPPAIRSQMLRWRWRLGQVSTRPRPTMIKDLAFAEVPGEERPLLCDLWLPSEGVPRSGLGVIYLHGGSWQAFDKDVMTRPFFRHLAAQGHVVMDVAYRLARETDMEGMVGDVKRAIAWLRTNGRALGIDPAKIVLAGGSAGGHLALLAAYTPNSPDLDPPDVQEMDTAVRGVIAYYPVADLRTLTDHWSEQTMHPVATALGRALGYFPEEGYLPWSKLAQRLFGAPAKQAEAALLRFSPVAHVGPHCPPTLLLQGLHDHVVPVRDVQDLHAALVTAGRPTLLVELPQVEHAFDMIALQISPPAQAALYEVDRFLVSIT